jgi:DnaK suppressor protein
MASNSGLRAVLKETPTLEQLATIRRELERQRLRLIERRKPGNPVHFVMPEDNKNEADQVAQLIEQTAAISLAEHTECELGKVCEALRRMERGEYGVCSECRGAIGMARLRVNPVAVLCLPCQRYRNGGPRDWELAISA